MEGVEKIGKLGLQKKLYSSDEVQEEIDKIYQGLLAFELINEKTALEMMKYFATVYLSNPVKKVLDKNKERGLGWFVGKSFELFYNTLAVSVYANSEKKVE